MYRTVFKLIIREKMRQITHVSLTAWSSHHDADVFVVSAAPRSSTVADAEVKASLFIPPKLQFFYVPK